jgi:hypothetical protein
MCLPPEQTQTPTTTYRGWWMVGVCEDPHRVGVWWDFGGRCEFGSNPPFFRHGGGLDHPIAVPADRRQSPARPGDSTDAERGHLENAPLRSINPPRRTNSHRQIGSAGPQRRPKLPPTTQTPTKAQNASNQAPTPPLAAGQNRRIISGYLAFYVVCSSITHDLPTRFSRVILILNYQEIHHGHHQASSQAHQQRRRDDQASRLAKSSARSQQASGS